MAKALSWNYTSDASLADKQVASVVKSNKQLHQSMHIAAVSALMVARVHGQSGSLVRLLTGLSGTSVHVKGLKEWAEANAPIHIGLDADKKIKVTFTKGWVKLTEAEAKAISGELPSFWTFSPPPSPFKGYSLEQKWNMFVQEAKAMAEAKQSGSITKKGEVVELNADQIKAIDLSGWEKIIGGAMPAFGSTTETVTIN